jgi:phenylalanyl-tRNA synthetase beta chain
MPGGGVIHAPVTWLAEYASFPAELSARALSDALVRIGLEVERITTPGDAVHGPLVIGRIVEFVDEPQKNGRVIRWCQVDCGPGADADPSVPGVRGIVCGAHNFIDGDLVVVALPGAVLTGDFRISARPTYGHISDGMICSARELGLGDDHTGIIVLAPDAGKPGDDARTPLGLDDAVLTISVTPDRGYCLSIRGLAREAATVLGVGFVDIGELVPVPPADERGYPVRIDDPTGCDQFSVRVVTDLDPAATSPDWLQRRLRQAGMRPISLAVDVTNYVMLETGQPLHAFDRDRLSGPLGVRRASAGEQLVTLDGATRRLDADDLVVTDDSGPIALAGVMGGASTEIDPDTTSVVLEAAHWDPGSIARAVRRHRLPSEAAKRFERGVDPKIAGVALQRCVELLVAHGKATAVDGFTVAGPGPAPVTITMAATRPSELVGLPISRETVLRHLSAVGCAVSGDAVLRVIAPSWRPDLVMAADLVEEVVRLVGYDHVPSVLPSPPVGRGLTERQLLRRAVSRGLAAAGYAEVLANPFVSPTIHDAFGLAPDDPRRRAAVLANPLSDAEPELRTSLLPGLLGVLQRNLGRGLRDLALFEVGLVFLPGAELSVPPRPPLGKPPSPEELAALYASVPDQPRHVGTVLTGEFERGGWWGGGRTASWADAVQAARIVAGAARAELTVRRGMAAPWHPGRCAELVLDGQVVGYAGELHPRVVAALDLPPRTCAMELDLDALPVPPPVTAPPISPFPPVLLDVALTVPAPVPAADVLTALREGAGELLESVRLFDVYTDAERLGPDVKSLAFALRFRAPDRTLTVEEARAARDAAVTRASELTDAQLRS